MIKKRLKIYGNRGGFVMENVMKGTERRTGKGTSEMRRGRQGMHQEERRLSSGMAMVIGAVLACEIIIAGAMLFNYDFRGTDIIALTLGFVVLYFCIVAALI